MPVKVCRICSKVRDIRMFHKKKGNRYGRDSVCCDCQKLLKRRAYTRHSQDEVKEKLSRIVGNKLNTKLDEDNKDQ